MASHAYPVPGYAPQSRRAHPTFMLPAEPPSWGDVHKAKGFRQRIKEWNLQVVGDLNALPYVVFVNIAFKLAVYWYVFQRYLMNENLPLFSEENVKRFIIYNVLGDVLGLNATGGPLGFRVKYFFCAWYNLLMPGSITCPLIPGWPAKRQIWQSFGYLAYLYFLVAALRAPQVGFSEVAPIIGTLAVLTPFDFVTFQASRGEHYGYMLFACLFPWAQTLPAIRLSQSCLWFFAGTAKMGPWMKYVNAFMMPNSKIIALLGVFGLPVSKFLYNDLPRDVNPSKYISVLAQLAVIGECSLGPLCLFLPSVGVPLALAFHTYILSMTPFASVMEWNCYCIFMVLALFSSGGVDPGFTGYTIQSFGTALASFDKPLAAFLLLVLLIVPVYGQLQPKNVPFLTAFRPYAGNWRFTWHIVDNKATEKLRKLKSLEGVFIKENARMLWGANPHFCDQFEDYFTGNMVFFPHFRPLIPMVEKLQAMKGWGTDDYTMLFNEVRRNAITCHLDAHTCDPILTLRSRLYSFMPADFLECNHGMDSWYGLLRPRPLL